MQKLLSKYLVAGVGVLAVTAGPVNASFFQNATGLASPAQTVTFSEVSTVENQTITTEFASLGVFFSPHLHATAFYNGGYPHMTGIVLANFTDLDGPAIQTPPFDINFSTVQTSAAFAFVSNPGITTFNAYLGATLVESASPATGYGGDFYGFTGINFDRIEVFTGGQNNAMILDNLQTGAPVPEPSTYLAGAMLALVFGVQGVRSLRSRKQVA